MEAKFEFDPNKSHVNLKKHGVDFHQACELWLKDGIETLGKSNKEPRFIRIGLIGAKLYSCVFTIRGEVIRIISVRRSRIDEEIKYHEKKEKADNFSRRIRQKI